MSRVLVDTNVVISALLFPNSTPARALTIVLDEHRLALTQGVLDELHDVIGRNGRTFCEPLRHFLKAIDCEFVEPGDPTVAISDPNDQPLLDAAALLPSTCWSRATKPFSDSISCSRE